MYERNMQADVIIATPGNSMCAEYVQCLVRTLQALQQRNISYVFTNAYSSLVHHARELTASGAGMPGKDKLALDPSQRGPLGNFNYKKIFWIDSDISWTPEDFLKLYDSDKNIVTGVYRIADGSLTSCMTQQHPRGIPTDMIRNMKGHHEISGTGFGFIAIKYGVFENMSRPWFVCLPQQVAPNVIDSVSEDISWCIKAKQAGYKIYLDAEVRVGHIKTRNIAF